MQSTAHVLLCIVQVWAYAEKHNLCKGYTASQLHANATEVTFGQLQGRPLAFTNENRPYKRCLRFQGIQAMRRAEAKGWLPKGGKSAQELFCNSEGAQRMDAWLCVALHAPAPPGAEADVSESD
jgi:hypothetical protein